MVASNELVSPCACTTRASVKPRQEQLFRNAARRPPAGAAGSLQRWIYSRICPFRFARSADAVFVSMIPPADYTNPDWRCRSHPCGTVPAALRLRPRSLGSTVTLPRRIHCAGINSSAGVPVEKHSGHRENHTGVGRKPFAFPPESPSARNPGPLHPGVLLTVQPGIPRRRRPESTTATSEPANATSCQELHRGRVA